jgi:hypothetical protein
LSLSGCAVATPRSVMAIFMGRALLVWAGYVAVAEQALVRGVIMREAHH